MTDDNRPLVIGIIGGSGVYDIEGLTNKRWVFVQSPLGKPSDELLVGELNGQQWCFCRATAAVTGFRQISTNLSDHTRN